MKNVAVILLYDDKKRFLLQHRTADALVYPNVYGFFGGKIDEGESPETAVKRECNEELEYELKNPKLILNTTMDSKYGKRHINLFLEKYDPSKKIVLHEGQGLKWVSREEVDNIQIADYLIETLKEMYNKI
jgi:mutator protein MutT